MLKRLALASASLLVLAGAAAAADLPPRAAAPMVPVAPAFTWSGFYVGTHNGYMNLNSTVRTQGNAPNTIANVAANRRPAEISNDGERIFSGVQAGYNLQFGRTVIGIEADVSYTDLSARNAFISTLSDFSLFRQDIDFFGTVRGRFGIAFDQFLVYGTAGVAGADVNQRVAFLRNTDLALQFAGRRSDTEFGFTVGGGIEFVVPTWLRGFDPLGYLLGPAAVPTVKAEYLYFDLGDNNRVLVNAIPGVGLNSYTSQFETKGHIGKIGFNYKFGT